MDLLKRILTVTWNNILPPILLVLLMLFYFALIILTAGPIRAEDGAVMNAGSDLTNCLWIGGLISVAVAFLKKISFVANYPKLVATILSAVVAVITSLVGAHADSGFWTIVLCILTQLAAAIGTHEVALKHFTSGGDDDTLQGNYS